MFFLAHLRHLLVKLRCAKEIFGVLMDSGSVLTTPNFMLQKLPLHAFIRNLPFQANLEEVEIQNPRVVNRPPEFWLRFAKPLGFILAGFLVLFLITSACGRYRLRSLKPKTPGRRLASEGDDDDDLRMPSSPALEVLCGQIGSWDPSSSVSDDGRTSPQLVEEYFRKVESSGESAFTTPVHGFPPATPGRSDEGSDGEQPGPSWAPPKRRRRGEGGAAEGLGSEEEPSPSKGPCKQVRSHQTQKFALPSFAEAFLRRGALTASSVQAQGPAAPVSTDVHSTPTATFPPSEAQPSQVASSHPFVHLPTVQPDVRPRPWLDFCVTGPLQLETPRAIIMKEIHDLLRKPVLDEDDVRELMLFTERLANFALHRLSKACARRKACEMVCERGLRFMALNALHSALQVIPGTPPPWWPIIVDALVKNCETPAPKMVSGVFRPTQNKLARMLGDALMKYKSGGYPSCEEVMEIKWLLFCSPTAPAMFKRPEWNPWREDCDKN